MTPLTLDDILPLELYAAVRPALRDAVLAHKRNRRVSVGDRVTLVFEDRETLRWQVQEMCRVEGIRDDDGVRQELEVYNELMPGEGELSATLYVEITDQKEIRSELDRLIGIDEHVSLGVGDESVAARFDPKQLEEDRIAAVQYIRFALEPEQIARFCDPGIPVRIRIDHPNYGREVELPQAARRALEVDLRGDPEPLVDPRSLLPRPGTEVRILRESGRVRALRPAVPRAPGHVVVEARDAAVGFSEADPQLLAELLGLAQEMAREVLATHSACRVQFDAAAVPVRCDVYAPGGEGQ